MDRMVELQKISFRYTPEGPFVLKDLNLDLHAGEFMVLAGPSGEGKSTLLSLINGVIPGAASGEVRIAGTPVRDARISDRARQVGSVLQNADSQIVHDIVEDEIAFGCENRNLPPHEIERRINEACGRMSLSRSWATRTLSGGQKQRLVTACTLAMGQRILLLDEPLANLDTAGAGILLSTLRALADEGYAVLMVEHRLDMVIEWVDTVAFLENGSVRLASDRAQALKAYRRAIPDSGAIPIQQEFCLRAENLAYSVGGRDILTDVSFAVRQGERVVILGDNGCGKTTLLRLLARLIKPSGGRIGQHLDPALKKASPAWFRRVGYIYQNPNYQLFMPTVTEELAYAAGRGQAEACLDAFRLHGLADRHPQSLSEGQKRRVSIAAVCAGRPDVLLLDEPTVGQDQENLRLLVEALSADHRARGTAMITVTHDVRCAAALADTILWLKDGRVYKQGGKELADRYFGGGKGHAAGF